VINERSEYSPKFQYQHKILFKMLASAKQQVIAIYIQNASISQAQNY